MRWKSALLGVLLAGACLGAAAGAEAARVSGSISLGKSKSRSETTVIVSPDGGTVSSTTRSESRGGGIDISFGRDRRYDRHDSWDRGRRRWDHGRGYVPAPSYDPGPYGGFPVPYSSSTCYESHGSPYYGPRGYVPAPSPYGPPRYEPYSPYGGYGYGLPAWSQPRVRIGLPTERIETRREVIIYTGPQTLPSGRP